MIQIKRNQIPVNKGRKITGISETLFYLLDEGMIVIVYNSLLCYISWNLKIKALCFVCNHNNNNSIDILYRNFSAVIKCLLWSLLKYLIYIKFLILDLFAFIIIKLLFVIHVLCEITMLCHSNISIISLSDSY